MSEDIPFVEQFIKSIKHHSHKELLRILEIFPYDIISRENLDLLLALLLNISTEEKCDKCFQIILDTWMDYNIMEEKFPTPTKLFQNRTVNDSTLTKLKDLYKEYSLLEHFVNFIDNESTPETSDGLKRLDLIYGESKNDLDLYKSLFSYLADQQETEEIANLVCEEFITEKISQINVFTNKPDWVTRVAEVTGVTVVNDVKMIVDLNTLPFPNRATYIDLLTAGLNDKPDYEETKTKVGNIYDSNQITVFDKMDPVREIVRREQLNNLSFDKTLFRTFGPSNVMFDYDFPENEKCSKYGGCRMFECDHFSPDKEWFTGSCEECMKRIKYYHYAVRFPYTYGGWEGCYCSWECIRRRKVNVLTTTGDKVLKYYEKHLSKIGIQDR